MNKRRFKKAIRRLRYLPWSAIHLYTANKIRHFLYKLTGSTRVAYPATIMLELTNHCNLHCTTCPREYAYGKNMDKGYMDLNRAKAIIDEIWPYLDSIGLTGMGETFLYKEIEEIVDYIKAKNKGIIISVSTNAVLPDFPERVNRIIGKIDTIQISIDGLEEVYESIRHYAEFSRLNDHLGQLAGLCRDTDTDLMLNMVVTKENYHHMPALVEYAHNKGVGYLDFTTFNLASVTDVDISYYKFYQSEEFKKAVKDLDIAEKKYAEVYITRNNFKAGQGFKDCPFPWSHFYISQDGYVPPCCAKPFPKEKHFGNVFGNKFIDSLNNKEFREFRELWKRNETPVFCEKCNFVGLPKQED